MHKVPPKVLWDIIGYAKDVVWGKMVFQNFYLQATSFISFRRNIFLSQENCEYECHEKYLPKFGISLTPVWCFQCLLISAERNDFLFYITNTGLPKMWTWQKQEELIGFISCQFLIYDNSYERLNFYFFFNITVTESILCPSKYWTGGIVRVVCVHIRLYIHSSNILLLHTLLKEYVAEYSAFVSIFYI